ncbi:hypothetical protein [Paenibacillus dakarensis]|uniref:hypothetical protein n=1 Tax=Paenibacillus dakarensis TaxID=1527293 RepID=UPI0006D585AF|nr:hypothetical protein [Paenibacillus dakarensis]
MNTGRKDIGYYALNKLASAGAILLLFTVISWLLPEASNRLSSILGKSAPIEHWVYGYALIASLTADAALSLLPPVSRLKQAALYAAAGFLFFSLLESTAGNILWNRGVIGVILLLLYFKGKESFTSQSLITLFFALVVPLLCWTVM